MKNIRVASVQFQHAPGDKAFNLEKIKTFVEHAVAARRVELPVAQSPRDWRD